MIKNLVVNGCSYTAESSGCVSWAQYLAEKLEIDCYKNLAMGGAGNRYICWSTMEYLTASEFDPEETLVVIMWSGVDRKDMMISHEWAQHLGLTYGFVPQQNYPVIPGNDDTVRYLLSGGCVGSWLETAQVSEIFHPMYRVSDRDTMSKESLFDFVNLQNYLERHRYRYKFTTFMNLWNSTDLPFAQMDCSIAMDRYAWAQKFDWSPWFFVDQEKNGLAEFAYALDQLQDLHPTTEAHREFTDSIVWPNIKELL